ncbi:MAG: hypothetical protein ACRDL6_00865 [Solirubrobacterales bacterium]
MSAIYELIGRLVVGLVRWRYQRELRAAAAVGVAATALAIGAYIATRHDDEED